MNISQLKKRVAIRLLFYSIMSIGLIVVLAHIILYTNRVFDENQSVINEIRSIKLEIIELQKKEVFLNKNLDLWRSISSSSLYSDKYIENLNFELAKLYKKYYILEPEISISVPEEVELGESEYIKVIKSEVTLNFGSISDKHIFLFLQSVPSLPGYVTIKSLILNKEKNIDSTIMNQILSGNIIEIVRANMIFDWYTVLNK
ncbi:MAG: hypothetical protein LKM44_02815 [Wolbachia endosymbiont of Meromenopon meropis]|nr:hypothetical protein [Wolbachia endosymbiont of Meromenopon meropis]